MKIIILEDQYTEQISNKLLELDNKYSIPIKWNIKNPCEYYNIITSINGDYIIVLDNYFPGKPYEEPLGKDLLGLLLKTNNDYRIICISDRGERLKEDYSEWQEAEDRGWIIGWCPTKDGKDIHSVILK